VLDPVICIYECPVRIFKECQNLPKPSYTIEIPALSGDEVGDFDQIEPIELWSRFHENVAGQRPTFSPLVERLTPEKSSQDKRPMVIDLREPSEYQRGHIADSSLLPLPKLIEDPDLMPDDWPVIFVCRSGRRSLRAAVFMRSHGYENISILRGGMRAWEDAGLLTAVDRRLVEEVDIDD
jgi:SulP family sulfate permease